MKNLKGLYWAISAILILTSCNKEVEDNIDRYDAFRSSVSCQTGKYLGLAAEFNGLPVRAKVELKNRLLVIGGIPIEISTSTNENGGLNGVETNLNWGNSNVLVTLKSLDNPGDQPIVLDCFEEDIIMPPGMLLNELENLRDKVDSNPNCNVIVQAPFEIITENTGNVLVPAGTVVGFPAANQIDLGVYTLIVNDTEGEGTVSVFALNGEAFSLPFVETFSAQPRFVCQQPNGTLTNEWPEVLNQWTTTLSGL